MVAVVAVVMVGVGSGRSWYRGVEYNGDLGGVVWSGRSGCGGAVGSSGQELGLRGELISVHIEKHAKVPVVFVIIREVLLSELCGVECSGLEWAWSGVE